MSLKSVQFLTIVLIVVIFIVRIAWSTKRVSQVRVRIVPMLIRSVLSVLSLTFMLTVLPISTATAALLASAAAVGLALAMLDQRHTQIHEVDGKIFYSKSPLSKWVFIGIISARLAYRVYEVQTGVPAPSDLTSIANDMATLIFIAVFGGYMAAYPILILFAHTRKKQLAD